MTRQLPESQAQALAISFLFIVNVSPSKLAYVSTSLLTVCPAGQCLTKLLQGPTLQTNNIFQNPNRVSQQHRPFLLIPLQTSTPSQTPLTRQYTPKSTKTPGQIVCSILQFDRRGKRLKAKSEATRARESDCLLWTAAAVVHLRHASFL